ncbi:MAG: anthranilate phosphoribosyltransferase [Bacillota bacterium]|nr:anthranilate phosphoribosyltransferase [Bacillota bacterium]HOB90736.1 anthranilate phosphoribosyltransferase [Bacillota bacterium]HPZ54083.1 anthranilate phosphoribosyltransferase [Bacillota bacterium]HQD18167.1 anthranilate phosphoribosyltransferase [Bacillota bacterium]
MIQQAIHKLVMKVDLSQGEAAAVMDQIMSGKATHSQIGAYLAAMSIKGETVDEIVGSAQTMRDRAVKINPKVDRLIDTCGTGGDRSNSFNVSTAAAFVVAGCGIPVAKHGNRSVSSRCGSADVLEALGVSVDMTPNQTKMAIEQVGIGFLFAPTYHPAMRHAALPRREIGIKSIFNILGPLANPAGVNHQVVGVFSPHIVRKMAEALAMLGIERGMVVSGASGLDEIPCFETARACLIDRGSVVEFELDPRDHGMGLSGSLDEIRGGNAADNARLILDVLSGSTGVARNIVILNAAAAIYVSGEAPDLRTGIQAAADSIDSGAAMAKLRDLIEFGRSVATA